MKNSVIKHLIAIACLLAGCNTSANTALQWDNFLARPNKDSFATLESHISANSQKCDWGNPNNDLVIPATKRQYIFKLIAEGDEFAFQVGLLIEKCLDGGELGDFYRSVGLFFELQPLLFLETVKTKSTSVSSIKSMLTMLPMDMVDNTDRQMAVIQKRIGLLRSIKDGSLTEIKNVGLVSLQRQEKLLLRLKEESAAKRGGQ